MRGSATCSRLPRRSELGRGDGRGRPRGNPAPPGAGGPAPGHVRRPDQAGLPPRGRAGRDPRARGPVRRSWRIPPGGAGARRCRRDRRAGMTAYVFIGPTLAADEARATWSDAVYLPPVRQGDVYRLVARGTPDAIGIVDGYFSHVPSVWHKEILHALSAGIPVYGAASMGALRAAELAQFGMVGVGRIFEAYRDGVLEPFAEPFEDDDEVAVLHGPPELGYRALSEALINIRCTLARATEHRSHRCRNSRPPDPGRQEFIVSGAFLRGDPVARSRWRTGRRDGTPARLVVGPQGESEARRCDRHAGRHADQDANTSPGALCARGDDLLAKSEGGDRDRACNGDAGARWQPGADREPVKSARRRRQVLEPRA